MAWLTRRVLPRVRLAGAMAICFVMLLCGCGAEASVTPVAAAPARDAPAAIEVEPPAVPAVPAESGAWLPYVERSAPGCASAPVDGYRVIRSYPHDASAFTQGLVYVGGVFVESTGLYGRSSMRRVDPETGTVLQQVDLAKLYFGEGATVLGDKVYQLTWQQQTGFVYSLEGLIGLGQFNYATEGWGLTHDGRYLIMSDGSPVLRYLDPVTYEVVRSVTVRDAGRPVARLNELEYIDGQIWANIWYSDRIARIAPETGCVERWLDLAGLLAGEGSVAGADVLNGIAYDEAGDRLFVTGKLWPKVFEIEVVAAANADTAAAYPRPVTTE